MFAELLSLGGALLGASSNRQATKRASRQFDAQMDESVQRRVKDAQKAGIHPLAALGASVGASPTLQSGPTGSAMGDGLQEIARQMGMKDRNKAAAARDLAEAQYLDAQVAQMKSNADSRGRDVVGTPVDPDMPGQAPTGYLGPTQRQGGQGGRFPDRIPVVDTMGNEYDLPNPDIGLDEVGQIEYVLGVPDRVVKTMRKSAETKQEIRQLEQELAWLRDKRKHGGVGADVRTRKQIAKKLREIRDRYRSLRSKAQSLWDSWRQ